MWRRREFVVIRDFVPLFVLIARIAQKLTLSFVRVCLLLVSRRKQLLPTVKKIWQRGLVQNLSADCLHHQADPQRLPADRLPHKRAVQKHIRHLCFAAR